jgi:outer membrane lipoprotein LolB
MRQGGVVARSAGGGIAARTAAVLVATAVALLLAACAGAPVPGTAPPVEFASAAEPFAAEGRLSARHGSDAATVHFSWDHRPPRDRLTVTSPLGQTIAELAGDASAGRVEVQTAEGRRDEAADWATLTERTLGFRLPVEGLAAWVRAAPRTDAAYSIETDREGRVSLLRQSGWEIVYDYADAAARRPGRLRITYPDLEIRMVIDRWE